VLLETRAEAVAVARCPLVTCLLLPQHQIHRPAPPHMRPRSAQVAEQDGVGAAGVLPGRRRALPGASSQACSRGVGAPGRPRASSCTLPCRHVASTTRAERKGVPRIHRKKSARVANSRVRRSHVGTAAVAAASLSSTLPAVAPSRCPGSGLGRSLGARGKGVSPPGEATTPG
jgi:hypothetical protein